MISKGDADKLKDAIDSHNQHIPMFVYGEINAMVEPEPGPNFSNPVRLIQILSVTGAAIWDG